MDYPKDNVFTFLFSTYKRTAGIAFMIVLILAIPITIALVSRQQDVRLRAQDEDFAQCVDCAAPPAGCNYVGGSCQSCGTVVCGECVDCDAPPGCNYVGGSCQSCGTLVCANNTPPTATLTPGPNQQLVLNQQKFDFNDDGKVDERDLNVLLAAFRTREGD